MRRFREECGVFGVYAAFETSMSRLRRLCRVRPKYAAFRQDMLSSTKNEHFN